MFGGYKRKDAKLEKAIALVLDEMNTFGPDSPEFPKLLDSLERLYEMRNPKGENHKVDPNTIWMVAGNIAAVLIIVGYEQGHVVTSRAMTFVARLMSRTPSSL